ncbi:THAP domain-containing protein 3-like [Portunus trituberculatus]|uniref:THAP domain-containing protein 3-like n=1 Tax=Portunus trituberculatus TaxID=210409 RepID=UPI001E1CC062|nr:THAP domain-containing protein 3-like [Portunus trituberculatus]
MPSQCAVFGCSNEKTIVGEKNIRYFRFPRDEKLRKVWINVCRRSDKINSKNAVVCSEHFTSEDYIDDMKSRLLGIESPRNKRLLKNEAVPSLLPNGTSTKEISIERTERANKRNQHRSVEKMLCDKISNPSGSSEVDISDEDDTATQSSADGVRSDTGLQLQSESRSLPSCKDCQKIHENLCMKIETLKDEVQQWRARYMDLKKIILHKLLTVKSTQK